MNECETIKYSIVNNVATISLNRPKSMNAISQRMRQELMQVIEASEDNDDVRIVVIRAEGKGFSSGTDLSEGLAGFDNIDDQIQQEYRPIIMAIANSSKAYMSSIHGACAGISSAIAMSCDLAVMADDAFLYLAFAGLSLVPDGGVSHHLVNAMGYKRAYQAFLEAKKMSAEECLHYGLVNKTFALDELQKGTQSWAEALAKGAPIAQKFGKKIMRDVHQSMFEQTLDQESKLQVDCSSSADAATAISAFFTKQKPVFTGK